MDALNCIYLLWLVMEIFATQFNKIYVDFSSFSLPAEAE